MVTFSEDTDDVGPPSSLTERARAEICRRVGQEGDSVAQVAPDFDVGWHTAMAAVVDHGTPRVNHLSCLGARPALSFDRRLRSPAGAPLPPRPISASWRTGGLVDPESSHPAKPLGVFNQGGGVEDHGVPITVHQHTPSSRAMAATGRASSPTWRVASTPALTVSTTRGGTCSVVSVTSQAARSTIGSQARSSR